MISVLMVCMGNICRSPMAEGIFRAHVENAGLGDHIEIESAGTIGYHTGNPPDPRAVATMATNGHDISHQRSRKVCADDFERFDYIIVMDQDNLSDLLARSTADHHPKISLFLSHGDTASHSEVPDPYYGGDGGFDLVYTLVDNAAAGLLTTVIAKHFKA